MKYFFILGKNPELSITEIASKIDCQNLHWPQSSFLLVEAKEFNASELIRRLGGTIKIGVILKELPLQTELTADMLIDSVPDYKDGKVPFGFSQYGPAKTRTDRLAMELKRLMKARGQHCRWVTSRDKALSSVVVEQNGLVGKGADFALLPKDDKLYVGRTLAVQPFKELSYRDFGRPGRDDRSGMLPPKLAQIMINLACPAFASDTVLFDPYCGSGTVLTEALLMGARRVIGLDISERAIKDTGDNIVWAKEKFALADFSFDLFRDDARQAGGFISAGSVDAIVTEPYLGPQRGAFDMGQVKKELEELYCQSLETFVRLLKPGGRICMVWPVFSRGSHQSFLAPRYSGLKIARLWPDNIIAKIRPNLSERGLPVYSRPNQRVWREIVVLEKK